ncbi:MAG: SIMPL domain-containing protein [Propionibacteriaceae bacterium]|nr:SIMPL domain-containing protein [Propionibacteriaceae bacterium]
MTDINVFGTALGQVVPDIAVVSVTVGTLGYASEATAKEKFAEALAKVREALSGTDKKFEQRAWSRVWHDNEKDMDRHQVSASATAKFDKGDAALKQAIDALASLADVSFSTSWDISPVLRKQSRDELLAQAVVDAKRQAGAIAAAAGQKLVSLRIVAEPELFPGAERSAVSAGVVRSPAAPMAMAASQAGNEIDIDLNPEPVDMSVRIAVSYSAE